METTGCGIKTADLPIITKPYTGELSFYRHLENRSGQLKKTPFENNKIFSPFYFLLEIKEVENNGRVQMMIYDPDNYKVIQRDFSYGETGLYYEYIIFFDKVEGLPPGKYRAVVFMDREVIHEAAFIITSEKSIKKP